VKKTAFTHPIIVFVPVPMMTAPVVGHVVMPQAIAAQPYNVMPPAPVAPPMPSQPVAMPFPPPPGCPCPPGYPASCLAATPSSSDVDLDTCLSVLGMVADVCFSHQQPASIPSMCLSALGLLSELCGSRSTQPCY
jgi:hypothetical protein